MPETIYTRHEDLLEKQLRHEKSKNKRLLFFVLVGVLSISSMAIGAWLIYSSSRLSTGSEYKELKNHFGTILFSLGFLELTAHLVFSYFFIKDVEDHMIPVLETGMLYNKLVANAGIDSYVEQMTINQFLDEAKSHFQYCKERKMKVDNTVRILCIHLNSLDEGAPKATEFFDIVTKLLELECKIQFLIPNYNSYRMEVELALRTDSFDKGGNNQITPRAESVINTAKRLEKMKLELKEKGSQIEIKYYDHFISFPLLNYNNVWYQGNYMNNTHARSNYYIQSTVISTSSIAYKWANHFDNIWGQAKSKEIMDHDKENYQRLGDFVNKRTLVDSEIAKLPFKKGDKYALRTHYFSNIDIKNNAIGKFHYFTNWIIEIKEPGENCLNCTLTITTLKEADKPGTRQYPGVLSMDIRQNYLVFVFQGSEMGPILISGKIDSNILIRVRDNLKLEKSARNSANQDFVFMHLTYYSPVLKRTVTKISSLLLDDNTAEIDIWDINDRKLGIIDELLLKPSKTIISPPFLNENVISRSSELTSWMQQKYPDMQSRKGPWTFFYYVVEEVEKNKVSYKHVKYADLEIFENGAVMMKRKDFEGNEETYYGEINIRDKGSDHGKVAFVKLLRTHIIEQILEDQILNSNEERIVNRGQDNREIFMVLQWPGINNRFFNFTRGLVLSDRDDNIFPSDMKMAEAARCVIRKHDATFTPLMDNMQEEYLVWANEVLAGEDDYIYKDAKKWEGPNGEKVTNCFQYYLDKDKKVKPVKNPGVLIVQYDSDQCFSKFDKN